MTATESKKSRKTRAGKKTGTEPPWNVMLHNEWNNPFQRVIWRLRKVIPGMTFARATRITYRAHTNGQAIVKSCHKELAELYQERLRRENLDVTIEPAE